MDRGRLDQRQRMRDEPESPRLRILEELSSQTSRVEQATLGSQSRVEGRLGH